jgi:excisionase family DNA binding protein
MKRDGNRRDNAGTESVAELLSELREMGVEVTPDYLLGHIDIKEAARFLGTTKGEMYNLTYRHKIRFIRWGKRGLRFRRRDLIHWQQEQSQPALR